MSTIKKLAQALNSIDNTKRFQIITVTDKPDNDLYDDELADYNSMLANKHGDFSSINREES
jgi:cytochrome oxidase Cu insertion factor (SCO1/SenC/PrrC family)